MKVKRKLNEIETDNVVLEALTVAVMIVASAPRAYVDPIVDATNFIVAMRREPPSRPEEMRTLVRQYLSARDYDLPLEG